ncbi:hypothetical protein ACHQM5_009049 [Ranunculus cassubicifolius]
METGRIEDQVRNQGGEQEVDNTIWPREIWLNCDIYVLTGSVISMLLTMVILTFLFRAESQYQATTIVGILNISCLLPLLFVSVKRVFSFSLRTLIDLVMAASQCSCLIFVVIYSSKRQKLSHNIKILECVSLLISAGWNVSTAEDKERKNQWYRKRDLKVAFGGLVGSTVGVRNALDEAKRLVQIEMSLIQEEEKEITHTRDPNIDIEEGSGTRIRYKHALAQLNNRLLSFGRTLGEMHTEATEMRNKMNQI